MTEASGPQGDGWAPGPPVPTGGGVESAPPRGENPYLVVQRSPEFQELRRKFRGFVFPVAVFFLCWYFLYVLCAILLPDFMSIEVFGNVNIGLIFGLLQFLTTFAITFIYARWANRVFDPAAAKVVQKLEEVTS